MMFVEPIRDLKKVDNIKNLLRGKGVIRDLLLFELGINAALRISDLLRIKVSDLFEEDGKTRDHFDLKESKTKKITRITITPKVKNTLLDYRKAYPSVVGQGDVFVFFHSKRTPLGSKAIGRKQAWLMISRWCKDVGLTGHYGGHTLRKTWGYQARKQAVPLEIIQHKLNHASLSVTQRYLGITADEIEEASNKLDL